MKTFLGSIVAVLALFGCSSSEPQKVGDPIGTNDDTVGPAVRLTTDPVSGERVRSDAAWKTYWHGNWYYFESEDNLRTFESSPTSYVTEDGRLNPERRQQKVRPSEVR